MSSITPILVDFQQEYMHMIKSTLVLTGGRDILEPERVNKQHRGALSKLPSAYRHGLVYVYRQAPCHPTSGYLLSRWYPGTLPTAFADGSGTAGSTSVFTSHGSQIVKQVFRRPGSSPAFQFLWKMKQTPGAGAWFGRAFHGMLCALPSERMMLPHLALSQ